MPAFRLLSSKHTQLDLTRNYPRSLKTSHLRQESDVCLVAQPAETHSPVDTKDEEKETNDCEAYFFHSSNLSPYMCPTPTDTQLSLQTNLITPRPFKISWSLRNLLFVQRV
jgi:hypothetical protein